MNDKQKEKIIREQLIREYELDKYDKITREKMWDEALTYTTTDYYKYMKRIKQLISKTIDQVQDIEGRELILDQWLRDHFQGYVWKQKEGLRLSNTYLEVLQKLKVRYDYGDIDDRDMYEKLTSIYKDVMSVRKQKVKRYTQTGSDRAIYNYLKQIYIERLQYLYSDGDEDVQKMFNTMDDEEWEFWINDLIYALPNVVNKSLVYKAFKEGRYEDRINQSERAMHKYEKLKAKRVIKKSR